jgi:hypothetical protein
MKQMIVKIAICVLVIGSTTGLRGDNFIPDNAQVWADMSFKVPVTDTANHGFWEATLGSRKPVMVIRDRETGKWKSKSAPAVAPSAAQASSESGQWWPEKGDVWADVYGTTRVTDDSTFGYWQEDPDSTQMLMIIKDPGTGQWKYAEKSAIERKPVAAVVEPEPAPVETPAPPVVQGRRGRTAAPRRTAEQQDAYMKKLAAKKAQKKSQD